MQLFGTVPLAVFIFQSFFVKNLAATPGGEKKRIYENQTQVVQDWIQLMAPTHLFVGTLKKPGKIGRWAQQNGPLWQIGENEGVLIL